MKTDEKRKKTKKADSTCYMYKLQRKVEWCNTDLHRPALYICMYMYITDVHIHGKLHEVCIRVGVVF